MFISPKNFNRVKLILTHAFGKYLLPTNIICSGLLMGLGDGAEQLVELKNNKHPTGRFDWKRICKKKFSFLKKPPIFSFTYISINLSVFY